MTESLVVMGSERSADTSPASAVVQPVLSPPNKRSPTGMHKELLHSEQRLRSRLLQSRVGRDKQRYDGRTRLLACIVVSRRSEAADEFLLISSSKHPTQWILPKGGWEDDESVVESALREADEEAGVRPRLPSRCSNFRRTDALVLLLLLPGHGRHRGLTWLAGLRQPTGQAVPLLRLQAAGHAGLRRLGREHPPAQVGLL
jgi:8-oxo-dGTP pyrophosphatase MutT (NUDIX family)